MALIQTPFGTSPDFDLQAAEAGDAAEMVTRLTALIAASSQSIADFKLAGAGSGPLWQAWFVRGDAPVFAPADSQVVAAVAGNPEEALFYLKQRLATEIGLNSANVYKVEVAGAGDGPTYMAVALFAIVPQ